MSRNITELRQINNNRYDYSKISGDLPLPNLVEIQTKSYAEFLEKGLNEVFQESFPIENYVGTLTIEYLSIRLGEPKHSYLECKEKDLTYNVPMYITVRLIHKETGEIQESEVFMGDLPLMTSSGTFISEAKSLNGPFMAFLEGGLGETILWPPKNGFPQKYFKELKRTSALRFR